MVGFVRINKRLFHLFPSKKTYNFKKWNFGFFALLGEYKRKDHSDTTGYFFPRVQHWLLLVPYNYSSSRYSWIWQIIVFDIIKN